MNQNALKKWSKFKDSCKYIEDINKIGLYCNKDNCKCSFSNCFHEKNRLNRRETPPSSVHGNNNSKQGRVIKGGGNDFNQNLTPKQLHAFKYKKAGLSFSSIGDKMGISKPCAYRLYCKALTKLGWVTIKNLYKGRGGNDKLGGVTAGGNGKNQHKVSLHNDSISFEAKTNFNNVPGKTIKLKYIEYKLIKSRANIIKVFDKKIVIQFRKKILGTSTDGVYKLATIRINNYLNNFKLKGVIKIFSLEQLSRHYAILGTQIAKKYIKEGRRLFIYDLIDGKERARIDYSDKAKGGLPHLEFTHAAHSRTDADKNKSFIEDIMNNPHYKPSETKLFIDTVIGVQKEYAYQIKKHLIVQDKTLIALNKIGKAMDTIVKMGKQPKDKRLLKRYK